MTEQEFNRAIDNFKHQEEPYTKHRHREDTSSIKPIEQPIKPHKLEYLNTNTKATVVEAPKLEEPDLFEGGNTKRFNERGEVHYDMDILGTFRGQ